MQKGPFLMMGFAVWAQSGFAAGVSIQNLTFAGSGCVPNQPGTEVVLRDTNGDKLSDVFEIRFSNYVASQGAGISLAQRRRNCNITVEIQVPKDMQFSVETLFHSGKTSLPSGVTARQTTTYEFPFVTEAENRESVLRGDEDKEWARKDMMGKSAGLWSRCGEATPLSIRTQMVLEGDSSLPAKASLTSLSLAEGKGSGLRWRSCSAKK